MSDEKASSEAMEETFATWLDQHMAEVNASINSKYQEALENLQSTYDEMSAKLAGDAEASADKAALAAEQAATKAIDSAKAVSAKLAGDAEASADKAALAAEQATKAIDSAKAVSAASADDMRAEYASALASISANYTEAAKATSAAYDAAVVAASETYEASTEETKADYEKAKEELEKLYKEAASELEQLYKDAYDKMADMYDEFGDHAIEDVDAAVKEVAEYDAAVIDHMRAQFEQLMEWVVDTLNCRMYCFMAQANQLLSEVKTAADAALAELKAKIEELMATAQQQVDDLMAELKAKTEEAVKAFIDQLSLKIKVVDELPENPDDDDYTVYLVKNEETNKYEEYIYIDGEWVHLGTLDVDLTQYYTKEEADENITNIVKAELENYYTKQECDDRFALKEDVYTKDETDDKYPAKEDVYTKDETDDKYPAKEDVYTKDETDDKYPTKEDVTKSIADLAANVNSVVSETVAIAASDWADKACTKACENVKADNVVWVCPDVESISAYKSAGIVATAQADGSLTFTCASVPSADITVNVACTTGTGIDEIDGVSVTSIKLGDGLELTEDGELNLKPATTTSIGGVIIDDDGLDVDEVGTASVDDMTDSDIDSLTV